MSDVRLFGGSGDLKSPAMHEDSGGDNVADNVIVVLKCCSPVAIYSQMVHDKRPEPKGS